MEESELERLQLFRTKVIEIAKYIREEHLRPQDFEGKTFYPDHPRILLAGFIEAIEELAKENE